MKTLIIKDATLINEGRKETVSLLIKGEKIDKIFSSSEILPHSDAIINATGQYLIPGVIDDQVHFREPGLTHKGDLYSESRAAIAGGITSFMEMPNTLPQTTTIELLEQKNQLAAEKSLANYSFYLGATNDNIQELLKINPQNTCGVKVFMGSSTGNMLVDQPTILSRIFAEVPALIATHCEDESTIQKNIANFKMKYGEEVPFNQHHHIRSAEACYLSSLKAVELARKYHTRLHLLHLSTAKELDLLDHTTGTSSKRITGEVCVHHLWFDEADYDKYGSRIKWNPAIKTSKDREALIQGLKNGKLDVVATDHAPHTLDEKNNSYFKSPSGGPLVQHSLIAMLELVKQGKFSVYEVVEKMCHAPALLFKVSRRGFIREGYYADLVLIDPEKTWTVEKNNILYKCGWSPFEGVTFSHQVTHTFVNGNLVYSNGQIHDHIKGKRLIFEP